MITYTQSNRILAYNFGQTVYTVPNYLYIGLSVSSPGNTGAGVFEPVGGNYARVEYPNMASSYWSTPLNGVIYNQNTITFQTSSASWDVINYVFLADALVGGNILYYQSITAMTVPVNTTVQFLPTTLQMSIANV